MESNNINIKERDIKRHVKFSAMTVIAALVSSMALHVFVYPANFVPLGLEAVVTMLYALFPKINAGYFNLMLNAPLIIYALFKLDKKYVIFTLLFTLLSSLFLILLEAVNFPQYLEDERLLASIFSGLMLGVRTGLMLKIGASTGGVDIVARIVQKKFPHVNIERIITFFCCALIIVSYTVYKDFNCILLGFVQMFISERATSFLLKDNRQAIEVKIVTKNPEEVREDIVVNLRHSATIIESKGMYSGDSNNVILCVLNLYQMADLVQLVKKYPETFIYYSNVRGVYGNFRRFKDEIVK